MDDFDKESRKSDFLRAFWDWFDGLDPRERKKFNEYSADMAKFNFYNKFWRVNRTGAPAPP